MHRLRENTRGRRARLGRDVPAMSTALPRTKVRGGVGESVERPDGVPKVKGEFQYGSDLRREGMLFGATRSEEHTSELQSHSDLVCRLLLEKKKKKKINDVHVHAKV